MSSSAEHRLMDIVDEFAERAQAGERPSIEHYCARHPDLGDDLRELLDALNILDELKPISSETASPVDQNLPDQIGDYRIIGEIGRGGMGVVYEAEQESLGRRVAVKVLPRHQLDSDAAQIRFQREAKAAARMHHSNIVPVFEVGREGDYFFYAMQLIAGQGLDQVIDELGFGQSIVHSLTEQLQTEPPTLEAESQNSHSNAAQSGGLETSRNVKTSSVFSSRDQFYTSATKIALQAADALAYAHERGVIHRDIKPSNVLLDMQGVAWIADFGLAKLLEDDRTLTQSGDYLGTLRYMSPERFRGQCDERSDIYALGLTLYELLLKRPHEANLFN